MRWSLTMAEEYIMFDEEAISSIVAHLESCSTQLRALNGSSEDDFLSLGGDLREVSVLTGTISTAAGSVAELLNGQDLAGYTKTLTGLLGQTKTYLEFSGKKLSRNCDALRDILKTNERIENNLVGFGRIVKHLRVLGISTKIESARLGSGSTFGNIADDVEKLSSLIESGSADILKAIALSGKVISDTLVKAEIFEEAERGQGDALLEDILRNLSFLSEKRRLSSSTAADIVRLSAQIGEDIGDIVSSLQFHDITRQEIEHVVEVMDDLSGRLSSRNGTAEPACFVIGNVCNLQMNQLQNARSEFESAVSGIMKSFRDIAHGASETSKRIKGLIDASGTGGTPFFTRFKDDMNKVISILHENGEANRDLMSAVHIVVSTVKELAASIGRIEEIGVDIELLALNAQIRAAQTGNQGAALGVLAEAVRNLSEDARHQNGSISETLTFVSSIAQKLSGTENDEDGLPTLNGMRETLLDLLDSLAHLDEQVVPLVDRMEQTTSHIEAEIEHLVSGITVSARMEEALTGVATILCEIAKEGERLAPQESEDYDTEYLKQLEARYTMHKERSIHDSTIQAGNPVTPFLQRASGDELGANVELF